ncbi:hypothetical protein BRC83_01525 [Halobacteriales archaeon QS_1_68_17]|nr:MAG: hypothetical protein BRC83_01525 [Halobacteriales archaeon QS_1_68_17]
MSNATVVLSFEPVARDAVLDRYSVDYSVAPPVARRAVDEGTATAMVQYHPEEGIERPLDEHQRLLDEARENDDRKP